MGRTWHFGLCFLYRGLFSAFLLFTGARVPLFADEASLAQSAQIANRKDTQKKAKYIHRRTRKKNPWLLIPVKVRDPNAAHRGRLSWLRTSSPQKRYAPKQADSVKPVQEEGSRNPAPLSTATPNSAEPLKKSKMRANIVTSQTIHHARAGTLMRWQKHGTDAMQVRSDAAMQPIPTELVTRVGLVNSHKKAAEMNKELRSLGWQVLYSGVQRRGKLRPYHPKNLAGVLFTGPAGDNKPDERKTTKLASLPQISKMPQSPVVTKATQDMSHKHRQGGTQKISLLHKAAGTLKGAWQLLTGKTKKGGINEAEPTHVSRSSSPQHFDIQMGSIHSVPFAERQESTAEKENRALERGAPRTSTPKKHTKGKRAVLENITTQVSPVKAVPAKREQPVSDNVRLSDGPPSSLIMFSRSQGDIEDQPQSASVYGISLADISDISETGPRGAQMLTPKKERLADSEALLISPTLQRKTEDQPQSASVYGISLADISGISEAELRDTQVPTPKKAQLADSEGGHRSIASIHNTSSGKNSEATGRGFVIGKRASTAQGKEKHQGVLSTPGFKRKIHNKYMRKGRTRAIAWDEKEVGRNYWRYAARCYAEHKHEEGYHVHSHSANGLSSPKGQIQRTRLVTGDGRESISVQSAGARSSSGERRGVVNGGGSGAVGSGTPERRAFVRARWRSAISAVRDANRRELRD